MAINKKAFGLFSLVVGILLLIVGIVGMNISPAAFDLIFISVFLLPGVILLVIGIILLALYLHSVT
jgi:uncharacterized membrane protein